VKITSRQSKLNQKLKFATSLKFRVVLCRIRPYPTFVSKNEIAGLPLRFLRSFLWNFFGNLNRFLRVFIVQMVIFGEIWSVFIFNIFTIRPLFRLVFAVWVFLHYKQQHSWALRSNSCPVETVAARYFLFKDSLKVKIFRLRTKDSNSPTMLKQINSSPAAEDLILGFLEIIQIFRPRKSDM